MFTLLKCVLTIIHLVSKMYIPFRFLPLPDMQFIYYKPLFGSSPE